MPYTMEKPPDQIKGLPKHGKEIWVAAFNSAHEQYEGDEEKAAATAWAAVKEKYEKDKEGKWRAKGDVSLDQIRDLLWNALNEKDKDAYVHEIYPSFLIYGKDGKYYRLAWSILDGAVQLGDNPVETERIWVEARSQQAESDEGIEILMRLGKARDPEGTAWAVTICEPGFTKNGWYIPPDALREAAGLFENVDVNLYELPQGATHIPDPLFDLKSLLVKNKVGWIDNVKHVADRGLQGVLHFLDSAKWLGKNLLSAMQEGAKIYGLSYDCPVRAAKDVIDGKSVFKVIKFLAADSVDIVSRPAAGGKFNRAVASRPAHKKEEHSMKEDLWKLITEKRPDLLTGKDIASISEQELVGLARMAMEAPAAGGGNGTNTGDANPITKDDLAKLRCEMDLKEKLAGTDLPELAKQRIREGFAGRVFTTEELDTAIGKEKDYLAKMAEANKPQGDNIPASGITGGLGSLERAQMAVDRMFGLTKQDMETLARMERLDHQPFFEDMRSVQDIGDYDKIPAFSGLREMYGFFTGDPEVSGWFNRRKLSADLRSRMDITSATFSYIMGNTLGRRLVKNYRLFKFREELLISVRKPVNNLRQQEAVLVGGFGDLPDVDTEAADYQESAGVTDEESTYTVGKKGDLLTISDKVIINDDISIVERMVDGKSRAARRTHAKYVWGFVINNATCSDGTAWFTSGHGNLGATALSHAQALVAFLALAGMTEKDSGEPLGLLDDPDVKPFLVGPIALLATLNKIANEEFYYASNDLTTKIPNPLYKRVEPVPTSMLSADANDWAMLMPPNVGDQVEMGYLNGREEPEMFLADGQQSERMFLADAIRYKIRHRYAGAKVDYRLGYKAVVT